MSVRLILVLLLVALPGCANGRRGDVTAEPHSWQEARLAEGQAIYERSCASCHDPGRSDAPAIGVAEDWEERSRLWNAVLLEHAKHGYLEMPAKGGDASLSERQVGAAAEYMLTVTYPELPVD